MANIELCLLSLKEDSDSCDSDFQDDDDLGLDVDFGEHEMPYITSPVFPDLPRLKENKNPWRVNANGVQICDVGVGNDSDFAETKEIGVQAIPQRKSKTCSADFSKTDDKDKSNISDSRSVENLKDIDEYEKISSESAPETSALDKDHDLIREVYIENIAPNNPLPSNHYNHKLTDDESSLGIRDEDYENEFSDTDIECSDDSSFGNDEFWQPADNRRWVGVSPAKFRLLRRGFYD